MNRIRLNRSMWPRILIIAVVCICFFGGAPRKQSRVCIKDNCFYVELAATPFKRAWGLMFKKYLAHNEGMLFLFEEEKKHNFWMKNTFIPLDIFWIDKDRKIVFIKKKAQPCKKDLCPVISPDREAIYVLELNAGVSDGLGLDIGDTAIFHITGSLETE